MEEVCFVKVIGYRLLTLDIKRCLSPQGDGHLCPLQFIYQLSKGIQEN